MNDYWSKEKRREYDIDYRKGHKRIAYLKKYYIYNKKHILEKSKKYRDNNRATIAEWHKTYRIKNREKRRLKNIEWRNKNIEHAREYARKRARYKRMTDYKWKLNSCMATAIKNSLKCKKRKKKGRHWEYLLGYKIEDLIAHLEKKFDSKMSWNNYGKHWEIDHRRPKSWFNFDGPEDEEFKMCWRIGNLQPLEKSKNRQKSNRFEG
jgi:hypothetical protein